MALVLASVLMRRSAPKTGWKRRVAVARCCFVNSKADVISSVHAKLSKRARESVGERPHCLRDVGEESPIKFDETEETLQGFDRARALVTPYGIDFCRERPDALRRDVVAEELQVAHAEYAFVHVKDQSKTSQGVEQGLKIALVLRGGGGGHQDVINVREYARQLICDAVHQPLESLGIKIQPSFKC